MNYRSTISVSVEAAGGDGHYQYRFQLLQNGVVVDTLGWTEKNAASFDKNSKSDTFEVCITVKDGTGKTTTETKKI